METRMHARTHTHPNPCVGYASVG